MRAPGPHYPAHGTEANLTRRRQILIARPWHPFGHLHVPPVHKVSAGGRLHEKTICASGSASGDATSRAPRLLLRRRPEYGVRRFVMWTASGCQRAEAEHPPARHVTALPSRPGSLPALQSVRNQPHRRDCLRRTPTGARVVPRTQAGGPYQPPWRTVVAQLSYYSRALEWRSAAACIRLLLDTRHSACTQLAAPR
eukprot:scaffold287272_cov24-Tisochrysis_lutea.AAC.3